MDVVKRKWKRNMFLLAWERCRSLGAGNKKSEACSSSVKSKSWNCTTTSSSPEEENNNNTKRKNKCQVTPDGCFSVYVGPEKQRFVVKTEFANHPLFKMLLEDAESEYGFNSDGPILLPCDVDLFYKVLAEMDCGEEISTPGCNALVLCSPPRRSKCGSNKGYGGAYRILSPSRMLKLNQY